MSKVSITYNDKTITPSFEDSGWLSLPFINSWQSYHSTEYRQARYRKINGRVYIEGLAENKTDAPNRWIATLPVGFRPTATMQFPICGQMLEDNVSSDARAPFIRIHPSGKVELQNSVLYMNIWISLSGINFFVD